MTLFPKEYIPKDNKLEKIVGTFDGNYVKYKSEGDEHQITSTLHDKQSKNINSEWKIQLIMRIILMLSKDKMVVRTIGVFSEQQQKNHN